MDRLLPDERVAHMVVQELLKLGLITSGDEETVYHGLVEGQLREMDWRMIAEKALSPQVRRDTHAN